MPKYVYEGVNRAGKKVSGEVEATSPQEATNQIRGIGHFPSMVKEKTAGLAVPTTTTKPKKKFYIGGVGQKILTQFTVQLATLQDAGLPLLRSLKILAAQLKPSLMKDVITEVSTDVETGNSFSESLGRHPRVFDRLYVNMVKAGEAGGVLDTVLIRLSAFMEKAQALRQKVIGAMTYPAVVIVIAVLILTVIMTKVVPQFSKIFEEMELGRGLPPQTEILMSFSRVLVDWWFFIPVIPVAIYFASVGIARTPQGRLTIDRVKLKIPLFGIIFRKAAVARFSRTFGTLLNSGVPILEALTIVKNTVGNEVVASAIQHVHDSIREGESIVAPLSESKVFDMMVLNMIEVGEESGELDKMLHKIADNYETEVDALVSSLTTIIEPAIIVCLGVAVGFIVISLFSPLVVLMQTLATTK
ncbi:MAG: type II secretion system F family protein [Planctomycetota bacterium]|nr:type II secretion system F family protein [Planctomycetota bacterium]MDI6787328.1 type II secretion system F family protein [Planctomycetota bacterium]